jgi:hypothetical protein
MTDRKITHRQLMALAFVSLLSPLIRSVPDGEILIAGKAAWLSPVAAVLPTLALYGVMRLFLKRRRRDEGMGELILRAYGGVIGRGVLVIFALWLTAYTGLVLRVAGERLVSYVYNDTGWIIFAAVILAASWIAALGRVNSLARTAGVFFPIVTAVLITVFLFLAADIKPDNLLPVTCYDIPNILLAGLRLAGSFSVIGYYTFIYGSVDSQKSRGGIGYVAALLAVTLLISASTIGVLSAGIAGTMQSPFFVIIRNITFFNVLERIEAVVIALWVISDFVQVGSMLTISADLMGLAVKRGGRPLWATVSAGLALTAAILVSKSAFDLNVPVLNVVPLVNGALVFGVLPLTLLTARARKML